MLTELIRMKKILVAAFFVFIIAPFAAFGKDIDIKIKKIGIGSTHKAVIRQLGKPLKRYPIGFEKCAMMDDLILKYNGAQFYFLGDKKTNKFELSSINITSNKIIFAPNIKIGATKAAVKAQFGKTESKVTNPDNEVWRYESSKDSTFTTFTFINGKLIEIWHSAIIC